MEGELCGQVLPSYSLYKKCVGPSRDLLTPWDLLGEESGKGVIVMLTRGFRPTPKGVWGEWGWGSGGANPETSQSATLPDVLE